MSSILELREKRAKCVADARAVQAPSLAEKRAMTAEESVKFDAFMDESDKIKTQIDARETEERRASRLSDAEGDLSRLQPRRTESPDPDNGNQPGREQEMRWNLRHSGQERIVQMSGKRATPEYRRAYEAWIRGGETGCTAEQRALLADSAADGGFMVQPMQMAAGVIKAVDDLVHVRQVATVMPLMTADSLGCPTLDTDPSDPSWTGEVTAAADDSTMKLGRRELRPNPLAKGIKISRTLIRKTAGSAESLVVERLAYKFGIAQEKGFLTGTGANQPLGVFTASAQGISTSRDVSTDNTSTAITADGLMNAFYSLKAPYRTDMSCRWLVHRDFIKNARKLKATTGDYVWQPGLQAGQPDRLLGVAVLESEYAPNTFTSGLYVGVVGAFRYYWIAEALSMDIQRLNEMYANTNQIGYIGRVECDGMPVLGEAFARVKLG